MDYPTLGISHCWNDPNAGVLWVETYCATSAKRGAATTWRVSGLPNPAAVGVLMDEDEFGGWSISGADAIEIRSDVDTHRCQIVTGDRGDAKDAPCAAAQVQSSTVNVTTAPSARASASLLLSSKGSCSCC